MFEMERDMNRMIVRVTRETLLFSNVQWLDGPPHDASRREKSRFDNYTTDSLSRLSFVAERCQKFYFYFYFYFIVYVPYINERKKRKDMKEPNIHSFSGPFLFIDCMHLTHRHHFQSSGSCPKLSNSVMCPIVLNAL